MKFEEKEPEVEERETFAFDVQEMQQLRVKMEEKGTLVNEFVSFLDEGGDLFAKYGLVTFDNSGQIVSLTLSFEMLDDDDLVALEPDDNELDRLLEHAFDELDAHMIVFDITFLSPETRDALQTVVALYMADHENVVNGIFCKAVEA